MAHAPNSALVRSLAIVLREDRGKKEDRVLSLVLVRDLAPALNMALVVTSTVRIIRVSRARRSMKNLHWRLCLEPAAIGCIAACPAARTRC